MFWPRYPIFKLLLCYAAGVLLYNFVALPVYLPVIWMSVGLLFLGVVQLFKTNIGLLHFPAWVGASFTVLVMGMGLMSSALYQEDYNNRQITQGGKRTYLVQVANSPKKKPRSVGMEATILGYSHEGKFVQGSGKMMLYLQPSAKANKLVYGQQLWISGNMQAVAAPVNPNEFNYKGYLNLKGINWQVYARNKNWWPTNKVKGLTLLRRAKGWQMKLSKVIESWQLQPAERGIAKALLLGYKQEVSKDLLKAYSSAGAMHVLAVSGLHVGILFIMLTKALFFLKDKGWQKILQLVLLMAALWGYAMLTGLSASVVRAATMFSFVAFGKIFSRHTSTYNTLAVSALFLLVLKPTYLFEVGFQLSYAAVFGIVWLQPKLERLLPRLPTWALRNLWAITTVSIAAQLATFPLGLYYFHQFPGLFLLSNIVVIPLVTALMYYGIGLLIITGLLSAVGFMGMAYFKNSHENGGNATVWDTNFYDWLITVFKTLLEGLNNAVSWVDQLGFLISEITIGRAELCLLYALIILCCHWLISGVRWRLLGALSSMLVLVGFQYFENYQLNSQNRVTAYTSQQGVAWGLYSGTKALFIAPQELLGNDAALTFRVKHHWWAQNLAQIDSVALTGQKNAVAPIFLGNKIGALDTPLAGADFWLVHKSYPPRSEFLKPPKQVMVVQLREKQQNLWQEYAKQNKIKLYQLDSLPKRTFSWPK